MSKRQSKSGSKPKKPKRKRQRWDAPSAFSTPTNAELAVFFAPTVPITEELGVQLMKTHGIPAKVLIEACEAGLEWCPSRASFMGPLESDDGETLP